MTLGRLAGGKFDATNLGKRVPRLGMIVGITHNFGLCRRWQPRQGPAVPFVKIADKVPILLMVALVQSQVAAAEERAKAENVEIKFVVQAAQVEKALKALGLDAAKAEKKSAYFFDTKDLALFKQADTSVILRARTTAGEKEGETTVKLRSKGRLEIEEEWMQERRKGERLDRKFEKDQVVTKPAVESYSLDDEEDAKAIQDAAASGQSVKKIFSANQEDLVEAKTRPRLNWGKLEALGPVKVMKWEFEAEGLDLIAERWDFGDHAPTLEVSIKVDVSDAEEATRKLVAFLHQKGLRQDQNPETKTKEVLEYFSSRN
jgi:hypothetical protein